MKDELAKIDLEGKLAKVLPTFKAEFRVRAEPGWLTEWYDIEEILSVIADLAAGVEIEATQVQWRSDHAVLTTKTPWQLLMGTKYGGKRHVGCSWDSTQLDKLEQRIRSEAGNFKDLLEKERATLAGTIALKASTRTTSTEIIKAYEIQKRVFGTCKVETLIEEEEARRLDELLGELR